MKLKEQVKLHSTKPLTKYAKYDRIVLSDSGQMEVATSTATKVLPSPFRQLLLFEVENLRRIMNEEIY